MIAAHFMIVFVVVLMTELIVTMIMAMEIVVVEVFKVVVPPTSVAVVVWVGWVAWRSLVAGASRQAKCCNRQHTKTRNHKARA